MTRDEAARAAAGALATDELEIDDDAKVSHSEKPGSVEPCGAWVAAWVYVDADAINDYEGESK